MDDRVARAWVVLDGELEGCEDFYLNNRNERLGDHFRAWTLLESAWRDGISIDDVVASVDLDRIDLKDDGERILWLADLMGTYGENLPSAEFFPLVQAIVYRQSMLALDPTAYIGDQSEYRSADAERGWTRLRVAAGITAKALCRDDAAIFLGLTTAELESLTAEEQRPTTAIVERLMAAREEPIEALERLVAMHPDDRECNLANGAYLALSGKAADAIVYLDRAEESSRGWVSESRDAMLRYMYIDCSVALGRTPDRTFSDLISLPLIQVLSFGIGNGWDVFEYYLACRSWMVIEGKAAPFSSLKALPPVPAPDSQDHRPLILDGLDQRATVEWLEERIEPLHVEQLQTRTDIGALGARFAGVAADRESFLMTQIEQLMPRQRRQRHIDELTRSIANWQRLPQRAKDQLIGARYMSEDPALNSAEAVSAILFSIGLAVEVTARKSLDFGRGFRLGQMTERLESETTDEWVHRFGELKDIRNLGTHELRSLTRGDVERAWTIVLGDGSTPGLFDEMTDYAQSRQT